MRAVKVTSYRRSRIILRAERRFYSTSYSARRAKLLQRVIMYPARVKFPSDNLVEQIEMVEEAVIRPIISYAR